jgi:hypothetical protein
MPSSQRNRFGRALARLCRLAREPRRPKTRPDRPMNARAQRVRADARASIALNGLGPERRGRAVGRSRTQAGRPDLAPSACTCSQRARPCQSRGPPSFLCLMQQQPPGAVGAGRCQVSGIALLAVCVARRVLRGLRRAGAGVARRTSHDCRTSGRHSSGACCRLRSGREARRDSHVARGSKSPKRAMRRGSGQALDRRDAPCR